MNCEDDCANCGRSQKDRPTIFMNEQWCSDNCRKATTGSEN